MVISDRTKGCCSSDLNEPRTLTMTNLLNLTHTTRRGVADNPRATLLGPQDREHLEQATKAPAYQGQARAAGDLDGRDQGCRCGIGSLCRNLRGQIRQSG